MTPSAVRARLEACALPVPPALDRLVEFFALRDRWARTHNLSGPRALGDPLAEDVPDAVAVWATLNVLPLVDVGSGSGIPGLAVACLDPDRTIILVEPLAKRAAFLRTAAHRLGLAEVRVVRQRWPIALSAPAQVISRAVVDPGAWPGLAQAGGTMVHSVLRMLAARRPAVEMPGLRLADALDYGVGHPRRVERWDQA